MLDSCEQVQLRSTQMLYFTESVNTSNVLTKSNFTSLFPLYTTLYFRCTEIKQGHYLNYEYILILQIHSANNTLI